MTLFPPRGRGPGFLSAGQPMPILAGQDGLPPGFAAMELTVPPRFAGPIPHAHDEFDEAIPEVLARRDGTRTAAAAFVTLATPVAPSYGVETRTQPLERNDRQAHTPST